eukprot:13306779-Heterocapsa_arctica.AAC.1
MQQQQMKGADMNYQTGGGQSSSYQQPTGFQGKGKQQPYQNQGTEFVNNANSTDQQWMEWEQQEWQDQQQWYNKGIKDY